MAALGSTLLAVAACQFVAGTEDRTANPLQSGCQLPSGSGPLVRFANFVPDASVVDVCIRSAGGSWGEPIVLNGGSDCGSSKKPYFAQSAPPNYSGPPGFAYSQVTIPFNAPAKTVDVVVVRAGQSCTSTPLTQASGLKLSANGVTTLLRIGGGQGTGVQEKIEALPENYPPNATGVNLRFVHVMPGVGPLDVGTSPSGVNALPTTVSGPFLTEPLSFGQAPPGGEKTIFAQYPVTANGYAPILQAQFPIVAGVHGANPEKALLLLNLGSGNGAEYSLYMAGLPRANTYPQRGWFCDESQTGPSMAVQSSNTNNNGGNPLLLTCQGTGLSGISVDVFNTSLYGPNSPDFSDREAVIEQNTMQNQSPVLERDTDIMCFAELDFPNDIKSIVSGGGPADAGTPGRFPYNYWVQTNVTTAPTPYPGTIDNPMGMQPAAPTVPPCGASNSPIAADVAKIYQCMEANCDNVAGDPTGHLPGSTDCLSLSCKSAFTSLLISGDPNVNSCFDCIIDYVASDQPYDVGQMACTQSAQWPIGFGGQVGQLILSRYPLVNSDVMILPSTQYRQAVLYSQVQLEDQTIDFYCGFFTSTLIAQDLAYVGPYGNGGDPTSSQEGGAYANEQYLQALDLIQWVHKKSDKSQGGSGNPAIIVGDWRASRAGQQPDSGTGGMLYAPPVDLVPGTVGTLQSVFTPVQSPDWIPQCTYCPQSENPLNVGSSVGYFMAQPFVYNWCATPGNCSQAEELAAGQEESLLYTQPVIKPSPGSGFEDAGLVPLSQYYGLNIQIIRPR
jgi:hypothetical protein